MPLYEYECQDCQARSEELQRFSDPPLTTCRACGGPLKKLLSAPAFHLKGSGWYATDYGGKKKASGESETSGDGSPGGSSPGDSAKKKTSSSDSADSKSKPADSSAKTTAKK